MKTFVKRLFSMWSLGIHRCDSIEKLKNEILILPSQAGELINTGKAHGDDLAR